ncbi:MAG: hypothetical protein FWE22_06010 [Firmicutes bacterium]|nr:hypothetical protein [Bacillota bacterium]
MNTQYFRVTAYHPTEDISVIMDSHGMFDMLWQFSSFILNKGFQILEVSKESAFLDGNITKTEKITDKLILHASQIGKPDYTAHEHNGVNYRAVKVENKIYIPDRNKRS